MPDPHTEGQNIDPSETGGKPAPTEHTDPPAGPRDATPHRQELTDDQMRAIAIQQYNKTYSDDFRDFVEGEGMRDKFHTYFRMRNFPEKHDPAKVEQFTAEFMETIEGKPELKNKLVEEEQINEYYEQSNSQKVRDLYEKYGLKDEAKTIIRMQLPQNKDKYDDVTRREMVDAFNKKIEAKQKEFPELKEALDESTLEAGNKILEKVKDEHPKEESTEEEQGDDESTEKKVEDLEAARAAQQEKDFKEAQKALQEAIDDPLDVDKRKKAEEALAKAKHHHDEHELNHISGSDPLWSKLLKYFGVALYVYIGLQYAAAVAADAVGGGTKGR